MCCNSCNSCSCDNNTTFPVYLPLSQSDLGRLSELAELYEVIRGFQNRSDDSDDCGCGCNCGCDRNCGCNCGCGNSCCG